MLYLDQKRVAPCEAEDAGGLYSLSAPSTHPRRTEEKQEWRDRGENVLL